MNFSLKFKFFFGGLFSAAFLIFLINSAKTFTFIQLPIICSFAGPENSPDLLRLSDFLVTGPSNPKVGDTIYISFKLQNYGQYDLNLGQKGIFVAARNPQNSDVSFGFTRANATFEVGETITVSASKVLDKAGTWKFWPSYHLTFAGAPEKFGPNEWHACTIQVAQPVQDSDQDGVPDNEDNCPQNYNPQQEDIDGDNIGDVCDSCDDRDTDKDKIKNCLDKCPNEPENYNQYQDNDGCPDVLPEKALPDLFIERIICDSQNQRIGYVIKNAGNTNASSGHKTALIIQKQKVDEDLINVNLQPGSVKESYFPNYQLTQSVVISICADYFGNIEESSEDNNCLRSECAVKEKEETLPGPKTPPQPSLPDLIVDPSSTFSYDPGRGVFYFTVFNRGQADASSSQVAVYMDGIKSAEKRIAFLKKGEKREEAIPYDFSNCTMCREYRIEIRLDDRNEINEESELNNSAFKNITCSHLLLPDFDLTVEEVSIDSGRIYYTVSNRGRGTSPETTARLFIDSRLIDTQNIPSLAGGESRRFSFSHYSCVGSDDRIEIQVMPAIKNVRDCQTGREIGLGEKDYTNNNREITNQCQWPDLKLECNDYFPTCTITNIGRTNAPASIATVWCQKGASHHFLSSYNIQNLSPSQSINFSFEDAFNRALSENCDRFFTERIKFDIKADANDSIRELDEMNNWESRYLPTLKGNMADISVERIWLESTNRFCYELKNKGEMSVKDFCFIDNFKTSISLLGSCASKTIIREESNLRGGESRTICLDIPSEILNQCREEILKISVSTDYEKKCERFFLPTQNDFLEETFYNPCSSGMIRCSACNACEKVNVKGKILYQEAHSDGSAYLVNNQPIFKPARELKFKIEGDVESGTKITDSQGNFFVSIARNVGKEIHLKIGDCDMYGEGFNYAVRIARDLDRCNEYMIFDSRSATIPATGDLDFGELKIWIDHDEDFNAQYRDAPWRYEPKTPCRWSACGTDKHDTIQGGAAYFNIAETILVAREYADGKRDDSDPITKVTVEYPDQACDGTSCYKNIWEEIHLTENDGFNDGTIIHEYGHHLEKTISQSDIFWECLSEECMEHEFCSDKDDTEFAWSEGFAEYFGTIVVYHHPDISDPKWLSNPNVNYGIAENMDIECKGGVSPRGQIGHSAKDIEGTVVNVLWDLVDDPSDPSFVNVGSFNETFNNVNLDEISGKEDLIFHIFDKELDNWVDAPDLCEFIREGWDCRSEVRSERSKIDPILWRYNVSCERGCGYNP